MINDNLVQTAEWGYNVIFLEQKKGNCLDMVQISKLNKKRPSRK